MPLDNTPLVYIIATFRTAGDIPTRPKQLCIDLSIYGHAEYHYTIHYALVRAPILSAHTAHKIFSSLYHFFQDFNFYKPTVLGGNLAKMTMQRFFPFFYSVISTAGKLNNMPDHGGNRTYDLWNANPMPCQLSYAVRSARGYM